MESCELLVSTSMPFVFAYIFLNSFVGGDS